MSFESREEKGYTIVTITEARLDAASSESFQNFLTDLIDSEKYKIVIDLSMVKFMDSSGLGSLISSFKKINEKGLIYLICVKNTVKNLLDLTSMDKLFPIYNSLDEIIDEK